LALSKGYLKVMYLRGVGMKECFSSKSPLLRIHSKFRLDIVTGIPVLQEQVKITTGNK
jgi:hypothetical protein